MIRKKIKSQIFVLGILLFLICLSGKTLEAKDFSPTIRVGLWDSLSNVSLSAPYGLEVIDFEENKVVLSTLNNEIITVSKKDADFIIKEKNVKAKKIFIIPKTYKGEQGWVKVNKKKYRGKIELRITNENSKGFSVVNILPLEEYLYSVVPNEIPPSWAKEALNAQAVAARTFALNSIDKNAGKIYDIGTTTNDQVYSGVDAEHDLTTKAVEYTKGMVITYKKKPISAYFCSSSGGYTEDIENVWGTKIPYLKGVLDYDQKSPYYSWEKSFKAVDLALKLKQAGFDVGELKTIVLSKLKEPPLSEEDRGVSGRVKEMRFSGTKGSFVITGNKLRSLLNLQSTLFDIDVKTSMPNSVPLDMSDKFGGYGVYEMQVNYPKEEKQNLNLNQKINVIYLTQDPKENIIFKGKGWGHGIGLSQWGAKAMAEKYSGKEKDFYIKILKHYYTGIEVEKIY